MLPSFKSKIGNVYCPVYILELLTSVRRLLGKDNSLVFEEADAQCQICLDDYKIGLDGVLCQAVGDNHFISSH